MSKNFLICTPIKKSWPRDKKNKLFFVSESAVLSAKGSHDRYSTYLINKQQVESEIFFNKINLLLKKIQKTKGKIYFFGNGASASFSNHMALDWSKNGGVLALSLSDSSMLTALANDYSYDEAFVEFMKINCISTNDFINFFF